MSTRIYEGSYKGKKSIIMENIRLKGTFVSIGSRMVSLKVIN